jgi:hypothetical protein
MGFVTLVRLESPLLPKGGGNTIISRLGFGRAGTPLHAFEPLMFVGPEWSRPQEQISTLPIFESRLILTLACY